MLDRLTPSQTAEKLRTMSPEELHRMWFGRDARDSALAGSEVARRKSAKTYELPCALDHYLILHLTLHAAEDFSSNEPRVVALRKLDRDRREGFLKVPFVYTAETILRALYPSPEAPADNAPF